MRLILIAKTQRRKKKCFVGSGRNEALGLTGRSRGRDKQFDAMNSPEIKAFIRKNSHLFWYTPDDKKEEISHEFLVETILNYGDINAVIQLFNLLGITKTAEIFFNSINLSDRRKGNYHEITINFFSQVFKKYAH